MRPVHRRVRQRQRRQMRLLQQRSRQVREQALARRCGIIAGSAVGGRAHARAAHAHCQVLPKQHDVMCVTANPARATGKDSRRRHLAHRTREAARKRGPGQRRRSAWVAWPRHEHEPALLQQARVATQQLGQRLERFCARAVRRLQQALTRECTHQRRAPRAAATLAAPAPNGVVQKSPMRTKSVGGASAASKAPSTRARLASTPGASRKTSARTTHISSAHAAAAAPSAGASAALNVASVSRRTQRAARTGGQKSCVKAGCTHRTEPAPKRSRPLSAATESSRRSGGGKPSAHT